MLKGELGELEFYAAFTLTGLITCYRTKNLYKSIFVLSKAYLKLQA